MVYISAFTCIKSLIHTHIGVVGGSLIRRFPMSFRIGLVSVRYVWERELSSEYLQYWPLVQFWTPSSVTQCRRERVPLSPVLHDRRRIQNWTILAPWWWLVDWWHLVKNSALDSKCSLCLSTAHAVLISPNLRVALVKICGSASGNREKQQYYFGPLSTKCRLQTADWGLSRKCRLRIN